jgi:hypothetical protein
MGDPTQPSCKVLELPSETTYSYYPGLPIECCRNNCVERCDDSCIDKCVEGSRFGPAWWNSQKWSMPTSQAIQPCHSEAVVHSYWKKSKERKEKKRKMEQKRRKINEIRGEEEKRREENDASYLEEAFRASITSRSLGDPTTLPSGRQPRPCPGEPLPGASRGQQAPGPMLRPCHHYQMPCNSRRPIGPFPRSLLSCTVSSRHRYVYRQCT